MEEIKSRIRQRAKIAYYISILLLAASIPLSKYTTSLFQFIVLGLWLFYESDLSYLDASTRKKSGLLMRNLHLTTGFFVSLFHSLIAKFAAFFRNKAAMAVTSLLVLHVVGLIYTSDYNYAVKDLRTKLPLLLLPLFFSTGPKIDKRILFLLLIGYAAAIFGGTIYRLLLYLRLEVADPRAIDAHTSHIRFSLNAVLAIFSLLYFVGIRNYFPAWQKVVFLLIALWLIFFMVFLNYTTGISILVIVTLILLLYKALSGSTASMRYVFLGLGLLLIATPLFFISSVLTKHDEIKPVYFPQLEAFTVHGNMYYHDTVNFRTENGRYTGLYICDKELRQEWKKKSLVPIDGPDGKQQSLRYTLIRYLASLDLRKDSAGVAQLTEQDVKRIEAGITNANSSNGFNLETQINSFLIGWDNYKATGNANSNSLIQRYVYWNASLNIIRQHFLFGVGTGDSPEAFQEEYKRAHSSLISENRLRSHNQYLSIAVTFGIIGFFIFLFSLIYPMVVTRGYRNYLFMVFWLIFMISMLTEDTIESQEGVTFYAYFVSLFLFAYQENGKEGSQVEKRMVSLEPPTVA